MAAGLQRVTLGPLDHIAPANIPQSIIYLSLKHGITPQDAFTRLHEGLRQTILDVPWLNGQVIRQSEHVPGWRPGQLEVRYEPFAKGPLRQLRFNTLKTDLTFDDLKVSGFPLDTFSAEELLWASPFNPDFEQGAEVLMAQANFLPGGCLLVLSVVAAASDGTAMLSVIRQWAENCHCLRGVMPAKTDTLPAASPERSISLNHSDSIERKVSNGSTAEASFRLVGFEDEHQYSILNNPCSSTDGPAGSSAVSHEWPKLEMKPTLFYLPQSAYTRLRNQCTAELGISEVSGLYLICALMWQSIIRAWVSVHSKSLASSGSTMNQPISELAMPFDARPEFARLLPEGFLGNFNFENRVSLPIADLVLDGSSIARLAKAIQTEVSKSANRQNLVHAYGLLSGVKDYRLLPQMRAPRMPQASIGILAPMTLPFNDACFGHHIFGHSGRPEAFRPLIGECNSNFRTCFIIPRKQHGGIEFAMNLTKEEADFLCNDAEFTSHAFPLG